ESDHDDGQWEDEAEDEVSEDSLGDSADEEYSLEEDQPRQEHHQSDAHCVRTGGAQVGPRLNDALQPHPEPDPAWSDQRPRVGPGAEEVPEVLDQEHDAGHADDGAGDAERVDVPYRHADHRQHQARDGDQRGPAVVEELIGVGVDELDEEVEDAERDEDRT